MVTETATRNLSYIQAVNEALRQEMRRDPAVFVMGEDVAGGAGREDQGIIDSWGGPMRLTKGLITEFGADRVRDTPISEAGFVGAGVGAAATGLRPVVELMYVSFFGVCADQITNNAAKMRYMFGGKITLPLTIMTAMGAGLNTAAQHSETLYSIFTHFPGLKGVVPSDPYTAKGLMISAIRDDDPVIVFNNRQLLGFPGNVHVPEESYEFPIGKARIVREGDDVTLVGIGYTTYIAQQAADALAGRWHIRRGGRPPIHLADGRRDHPRVCAADAQGGHRRRGLPSMQRCERYFGTGCGAGIRLPRRPAHTSKPASHVGPVQPSA